MPDVVLISIPHTGTNFTIKLFADNGYEEGGLFTPRSFGPMVRHGHMVKEGQIARAIELARTMLLVIPFRHPYRVEESWKRRGKSLAEMYDCYRTLIDRFLPLNPVFVPVDTERREEAVERLSSRLRTWLTADWSVVNSVSGTHSLALSDCQPSEQTVALAKEIEPVMAELY